MTEHKNSSFQNIRSQMLNNILWSLVVFAGIGVFVGIASEFQKQQYLLSAYYLLAYVTIIVVAAYRTLNYHVRAFVPVLILYGLTLSEFIAFGATALGQVFLYSTVIFAGLLYGLRISLFVLVLAIATLLARFVADSYQAASGDGFPIDLDMLMNWLSPNVAFFCVAIISLIAITSMLKQLELSLAEKSELLDDLTQQLDNNQKTQKALDRSEDQYSALFKRSHDAVFLIETASGKHLKANHAAEQLTGRSVAELEKLSVADISPEFSDAILETARGTKHDGDREEILYKRADGSERIAMVGATPVSDDLAFVIARDVTERKKLEDQFNHSQKMDAIGQLAGGVAHDFNNSLQAILAFGETAAEKSENKNVSADLNNLLEAVNRAQKIVGQLLAFSRRQVLQVKNIDLRKSIDESLTLIRRVIGEHISLQYTNEGKPLLVKADRTQIEQVLMNLCINARDAISENGQLIIALDSVVFDEDFCVSNEWAQVGTFVQLKVTDTGTGIDEAIQKKMFEPFYTTKEVGKGTGLGLSTVFGIVRQHKGFINVESQLGQGTTIELYLPQIEGFEEREEEPAPRSDLKTGNETLLIADDDDLVRDAITAMLEMSGYKVLTAADGDEAIAVFEANKTEVDLVILDVVMPNSSASTVSAHMSKLKPGVPILFASGYSKDSIHTDFILDEGVHFIQKPYKRVDLIDRIRGLLDNPAAL